MLSFPTFLLLQLSRILGLPSTHAPGPKKPTLSALETYPTKVHPHGN